MGLLKRKHIGALKTCKLVIISFAMLLLPDNVCGKFNAQYIDKKNLSCVRLQLAIVVRFESHFVLHKNPNLLYFIDVQLLTLLTVSTARGFRPKRAPS